MSRPLRIEFEDALYHITARGNRQESIFYGDDDRYKYRLGAASYLELLIVQQQV